jgi:hypothetical protein
MKSEEVKTTVYLELEGRIRHAVSKQTVSEIESVMQAEHLLQVELDNVKIFIQAGNIEYLREGDQRPQSDSNARVEPERTV